MSIHLISKQMKMWFGDGIYYVCSRLLVPHRKPRNGSLTRRQIIENDLFAEARSAIEQVNALVVHHAMFEGRNYRGDTSLLGVFLKITVHATALYIRIRVYLELDHGRIGYNIPCGNSE